MSEGDYEFDDIPVEDLENLEESALQLASQRPATRPPAPLPLPPPVRLGQTHAVRHALAPPSSGPRAAPAHGPSTSALLKGPVPRPLNTTPGTTGTGFGWEQGGKRNLDAEGGETRFVEQVRKREMYWSGDAGRAYEYGPAYVHDAGAGAEEEPPDVVVTEEGGYGYSQAQVGQMGESSEAGRAARRAALLGANAQAGPSRPRAAVNHAQPQPGEKAFAQRSFTKSVSAGNLPTYARSPLNTSLVPRLEPIPAEGRSQSSSQPSSDGSQARRDAVALNGGNGRVAGADSSKSVPAVSATSVKPGVLDTGQTDLQQELWKARGETANVRRQQSETAAKHQAEREALKLQVAELEAALAKKDLETKKVLENVKSQAIFAAHTAANSVKRRESYNGRAANGGSNGMPAASQTPLRGSPRGKQKEREEAARSAKGKEKQGPPPRMGRLVSAFDTPSVVVKRQRTQAPSPTASPSKEADQNGLDGDAPMDDGVFGPGPGPDGMEALGEAEAPAKEESDLKAELLYHLFDCRSRLVLSPSDLRPMSQPIIAHLLDYRPSSSRDPDGRYAAMCGEFLTGCHDPHADAAQVQETVGRCLGEMFSIVAELGAEEAIAFEQIQALVNLLCLLALTAWRFHTFPAILLSASPSLPGVLQKLANTIYAAPSALETLQDRIFGRPIPPPAPPDEPSYLDPYGRPSPEEEPPQPPPREWTRAEKMQRDWPRVLGAELVSLAGALCWYAPPGPGPGAWGGAELVDIVMGLTQAHHSAELVRAGLELAWMASCSWHNFQAIIASSATYPSAKHTEQPVLDRLARLLLNPHSGASEIEASSGHEMSMTIVRTLSLLAVATHEAVLLVAERSAVVQAVIHVLYRTSSQIYGLSMDTSAYQLAQDLLPPTLSLLHFLVYPISLPQPLIQYPTSTPELPSLSQHRANPDENPQGIGLPEKLQALSALKEWNGIQHVFVSALGRLSFADLDLEPDLVLPSALADGDGAEPRKKWDEAELRSIQYMAQDVMDAVLQGPEEEGPIYEMFAEEEDRGEDELEELQADPDMEVDVPEL